jgi:hypothetical protein
MSYTIDTENRTATDSLTGEIVLTAVDEAAMLKLQNIVAIENGAVSADPELILAPELASYINTSGDIAIMITGQAVKPKASKLVAKANALGVTPKGDWAMVSGSTTGLLPYSTYTGGVLASTGYDSANSTWHSFFGLADSLAAQTVTISDFGYEEIGTSGSGYVKNLRINLVAASASLNADSEPSSSLGRIFIGCNSAGDYVCYVGDDAVTLSGTFQTALRDTGVLTLNVTATTLSIAGLSGSTLTAPTGSLFVIQGETANSVLSYGVSSNLTPFPAKTTDATPPVGSVAGDVYRVTTAGTYRGVSYPIGSYVTIV